MLLGQAASVVGRERVRQCGADEKVCRRNRGERKVEGERGERRGERGERRGERGEGRGGREVRGCCLDENKECRYCEWQTVRSKECSLKGRERN